MGTSEHNAGAVPPMDSIPSIRGEGGGYRNNSTEAGDRRRSDGPLGSYADLLIIT